MYDPVTSLLFDKYYICIISAVANGDLDYDKGMLIFYLPFRGLLTLAGLAWLATMAAMAKELLEDIFYGEKFANQRVSEV